MKLLAVYRNALLPSSRIRILQMLPHLERLGIGCDAVPYPRGWWALRHLVRRAAQYDLVWFQKELPSLLDYFLWKRLRTPIIFDFDDAIMFRQEPRFGSYRWIKRARRFRRLTLLATGITCGNRYLASLLPASQSRVLLYPSPVLHEVPRHNFAACAGPLRLGWIGHAGNLPSLTAIATPLKQAALKHDFELVVVSSKPVTFPGVRVINVPWSLQEEAATLAGFDVGLMPLDGDSPYDRGKCGYKILQYLAAGVFPVATAVGMNAEIIQDRRNGRLVFSADQWPTVLHEILSLSRDEIGPLAQTGPCLARGTFSYEINARKLAEFFASATASADRRKQP